MVWWIGCNTLTSWCITRFLCKWDVFATPLYHDMGPMWRLMLHTLYYTFVAPNCNTIFFAELGHRTHRYMLEPILLCTMGLTSHALQCEMRCWGTSDESSLTMYTLSKTSSRVWVWHCDTMLYLWSSLTMFSTHLQPNPILARISLIIPMCSCDCVIH